MFDISYVARPATHRLGCLPGKEKNYPRSISCIPAYFFLIEITLVIMIVDFVLSMHLL